MKTELVTEAFRTIYPYSFWWVLVPIILGIILFIFGVKVSERTKGDALMTVGILVVIFGSLLLCTFNSSFRDDVDEDLLRSDTLEQLQIDNVSFPSKMTYNANDWHMGKGPDGEFIEFALLKDGGSNNKYVVVYK